MRSIYLQQGTALIVSLLLLLVMTLLGVSAMQGNILEEKMAGNMRDQNVAFQAAEAALRDGEADIVTSGRVSGLTGFTSNCANGLCDATGGLSTVWKNTATRSAGVAIGTRTSAVALTQVACQPRYWIEGYKVRPPGSASWEYRYRVTAVGCGGTANTQAIVQSVLAP